jgi:hypothetical protein
MREIALVAGSLAALAVIVLVIRLLFLVRRVQRVWERLDRTIESDLAPGIRRWGEAAQGVRQAAGKLDSNLASLGRTLDRLDRLTEKLEPEVLAHLVTGPMARLASWVAGVRRGLKVHQHREGGRRTRAGEDQTEPND